MLTVTKVPRALENKTTVFGFEISELILIFVYLSASNFIFGRTSLKIPIVWGGTAAMAGVISATRRKRPDQYLVHYLEYYRTPEILSAGAPDTAFINYEKSREEPAGPESQATQPEKQ